MHQELAPNTDHSRLIGSGQGAKVYLVIDSDGQRFAKKVFEPKISAELGYRLFRWKEHPYNTPYTDIVAKGAYELRRIAHRVSEAFDCGAEIIDATGLCNQKSGFYTPFVDNATSYTSKDTTQRKSLDELEKHFLNIGLPVWSFGSYFKEEKRKSNVLIGADKEAKIIDYEAGWPYFNRRDLVGFDDVNALKFQRFITLGRQVLTHRLGEKQYLEFMKSWEKYQLYNSFWREEESAPIRKLQTIKEAFGWRSLNDRVGNLLEESRISPDEAEKMKYKIMTDHHLLERILPHFLAHFSTFIFLRFPFGSIARPTYTAIMRGVDEISRVANEKRRGETQIHDFKVMVYSGVPVLVPPFNFFAYLTKALGEEPLSYLLLDNISYKFSGKGLEEQVEELGARGKGKLLFTLQNSSHSFVRTAEQTIERLLGQIVSNEVVERSAKALANGSVHGQNADSRQILTRELVQATEAAIDKKYLGETTG